MKKLITLFIFIGIINIANAQFFVEANLKGGTGMLNYSANFPKAEFSYGGGLNFGYELKKHLFFNTGFDYYRINFQIYYLMPDIYYTDNRPSSSNGPVQQGYNYFTIPLKINYYYQFKNNIRLYAGIGLICAVTNGNRDNISNNFSSEWSLGDTGELGIGYKIKNILLTLSGEYSVMNNIHSFGMARKTKAYFYGLNIGLRYYF